MDGSHGALTQKCTTGAKLLRTYRVTGEQLYIFIFFKIIIARLKGFKMHLNMQRYKTGKS